MQQESKRYIVRAFEVQDSGMVKAELELGFNIYTTQYIRLKNFDGFDHMDPDPDVRTAAAAEKMHLCRLMERVERLAVETYKPAKMSRHIGVFFGDDKNINRVMVNYHSEKLKQVEDYRRQKAFKR